MLARFAAAGMSKDSVSFARDTFTFDFAGPADRFVDEFRDYDDPTMIAFEAPARTAAPTRCASC